LLLAVGKRNLDCHPAHQHHPEVKCEEKSVPDRRNTPLRAIARCGGEIRLPDDPQVFHVKNFLRKKIFSV